MAEVVRHDAARWNKKIRPINECPCCYAFCQSVGRGANRTVGQEWRLRRGSRSMIIIGEDGGRNPFDRTG